MKTNRLLAVLGLSIVMLAGNMLVSPGFGQDDDRMIGNGRLLRRLRNEIVGQSDKDKDKGKDKSREPRKAPTPAVPGKNNQPTPAARPGQRGAQPVASGRNTPTLLPRQTDSARIAAQPVSAKTTGKPDRGKPKTGFGMDVKLRNEQLVVTQVDSRGNAKDAGLRNGDVIVSGGGIDFASIEDFQQVTQILQPGDQLEFQIQRRGDDQKVMLQFGEAAEPEDVDVPVIEAPIDNGNRVNMRDNYSFLPEQSNINERQSSLHSVLSDTQRIPQQPIPATRKAKSVSPQVNAILVQQQQEIARLKQQLQQLQQPGNQPKKPSSRRSVLDLNGPR